MKELDIASFFALSATEWAALGLVVLLLVLHLTCVWRYRRVCACARASEEGAGEEAGSGGEPLSVVLVAHDEVELLRENLPLILEQDYPDFEVIVVNDTGSDEVEEVLGALHDRYPRLYHTFVPAEGCRVSRRKLALTIGIKAARHDCLVLTGCDCRPSGPRWLRQMAAGFSGGREMVFGYSRYRLGRSRHERRVRQVHFLTQLRYLASALEGKPYMAYGQNLGYRKSLFFRHKGFAGLFGLEGGEDTLFVNRAATGENTAVVLSPESAVDIVACPWPSRWRGELRARRESAELLRGGQSLSWALEDFLCILFQLGAAGLAVYGFQERVYLLTIVAAVLLLVRLGIFLSLMRRCCRALGEAPLGFSLLFLAVRRAGGALLAERRVKE